jgi:DNA polymerase-3 subunit alpha
MPGPGFIHLHVHSQYSLLEGALKLGPLLDLAKADKQPALGIADTSNLFGALEFSEKAAGKGIQPLISAELAIDFEARTERFVERGHERGPFSKHSVVLIAADETGYGNLSRLVSRAYLEGEAGKAAAPVDWLDGGAVAGLICLSGGPEGAIDPWFVSGNDGQAENRLETLRALFGDRLYVELQRHGRHAEQVAEAKLIDYAYRRGVPLVATNEPFFATRADYEAHDALLAIASGSVVAQTERRKLTPEHYFKTRAEMAELFKDLPEALENSVEIALRASYRPQSRKPVLPTFAAAGAADEAAAVAAEAAALGEMARRGLERRIAEFGIDPGKSEADYHERLEFELGIIERMKYPGYFLIVADFIQWAKSQGIPVGPGRGSGAGSLVAYATTITDLDPLRYNLLFERFLNPERVSMPDFDIDFCQDRREEVIRYVQRKYGTEQVAQIITFGTLQARAVLRDVGRVLQMPYGQVDRIAKLVPANPTDPWTLERSLREIPQLRQMTEEDEQVADLLAIGQKLEGLYRHASTHAAGIVIGDRPLQELAPLYRDPRSDMPVSQYNMKWSEAAGLVKFDFLGLKTLTTIRRAVDMINRNHPGVDFNIESIPLDDEATYRLYSAGDTAGVFQVEGAGMRRALVDMKPDRFEDIIAIVALYRPGPMDNIPLFNDRKHGREAVDYPHEALKQVLDETYGVIVYQEQVMQIAQLLSGYSLGEADMLRRAMGKKIKAEMDAQRERFNEGALRFGLTEKLATEIFDLLAKFANYGFNKSHAATYALVSYQTAYLKAHYAPEFFAATMTLDMGNTDKLAEFRADAIRHGIDVLPPSVNQSQPVFDTAGGKVHYAIGAVKGVGQAVAEHIVAARGDRPFADLADFATRVDPRIINRRTLETLVNAGAFDCIVPRREQGFAAIDMIVATAQRTASDQSDGIIDMFASDTPEPIRLTQNFQPWSLAEKLDRERSAIGFHISAHPLDDYAGLFKSLGVWPYARFEAEVREMGGSTRKLAGTVGSRSDRRTKKGTPMFVIGLSDQSGSYEVIGFSEQVQQFGSLLQVGANVVIGVEGEERPDGVSLRIVSAVSLDDAASRVGRHLEIETSSERCLAAIKAQLRPGGNGRVKFVVSREEGRRLIEVDIGDGWQLSPALAGGIKALDGVVDVRLN